MRLNKSNLKKLLLLILAFSMLGMTACGVKNNAHEADDDKEPEDTGASTDATQDDPSVPETEILRDPQKIKNKGIIDYQAGVGLLYNGIELPESWEAYARDPNSDEVVTPPYLTSKDDGGYRPDVIDVTVGRQLFVDDFLIESTTLKTVYHQATKYEGNPIVTPTNKYELSGGWGVGLDGGGVWYDMEDEKYKMWYDMSTGGSVGYAESDDGINWTKVKCQADGTNLVLEEALMDGHFQVFIDYEADASEKYKMHVLSFRNLYGKTNTNTGLLEFTGGYSESNIPIGSKEDNYYASTLYVSSDGINWRQLGGLADNLQGDACSVFYNEFTNTWVNSIRTWTRTLHNGTMSNGRVRYYAECSNFIDLLKWKVEDTILWLTRDKNDVADLSLGGLSPQTYNFGAIAYESIMIGTRSVWYGPNNKTIKETGNPKITDLQMTYSRDGFHFDNPSRKAFIASSRTDGTWDKGYLWTVPASVIIHDDEIWFYYSGFKGYKSTTNALINKDAHAMQQIGIAVLRRDGFASMEGTGELLTRKLTVDDYKKYLFVNINCPEDSFKAEIIDKNGNVVEGYSMEDCIAVGGDDTCKQITWKNGGNLSFLGDSEFQIRFSMSKSGEFYSFWLSDATTGESDGAIGSGYASSKKLIK